jgi:hypothetical protein
LFFGVTNAQKNDIAPQDLNGIRAIGLHNPKVK